MKKLKFTSEDIRNLRKELDDMLQIELAEILGVTVTTVSRWECGKGHPDKRAVRDLKKLINSRRKKTKGIRFQFIETKGIKK